MNFHLTTVSLHDALLVVILYGLSFKILRFLLSHAQFAESHKTIHAVSECAVTNIAFAGRLEVEEFVYVPHDLFSRRTTSIVQTLEMLRVEGTHLLGREIKFEEVGQEP